MWTFSMNRPKTARVRPPLVRKASPELILAILGVLPLWFAWVQWKVTGVVQLAVLASSLSLDPLSYMRSPRHTPPPHEGIFAPPADRRVIAIDRVHEPCFIGSSTLPIAIFLSAFG